MPKAVAARTTQKTKGKRRLKGAKLLPIGGEANSPRREMV